MSTNNKQLPGQRLRQLREERKLSMETVAYESGITYKALSKIELNTTQRPDKDTVDSMLDTLHAAQPISYKERNDVLNAYHYVSSSPLATKEEIAWARELWPKNFYNPYPGYLVDCSQRLLDWNRYAPRLIGLTYGDPRMEEFRGITIFDLALNPDYIAATLIANPEEFLTSTIYVIKRVLAPYQEEPWFIDRIEQTKHNYPLFEEIWDSIPFESIGPFGQIIIDPVHIRHPEGYLLKFQILGTFFVDDPRFHSVQYTPIDTDTMRQCLKWAEEEQELQT